MKEPLTLDEVANACFLSKSHFCKIFKEETGRTFKAYLNDIRIERAKDLLKNSTLKNYEIAQEIGIEDASYFNELFKENNGNDACRIPCALNYSAGQYLKEPPLAAYAHTYSNSKVFSVT